MSKRRKDIQEDAEPDAILVTQFSSDIKFSHLVDLFSPCGSFLFCDYDASFFYVRFQSATSVSRALKLDRLCLGATRLLVRVAPSRMRPEAQALPAPKKSARAASLAASTSSNANEIVPLESPLNRTIYVTNLPALPFLAEELKDFFRSKCAVEKGSPVKILACEALASFDQPHVFTSALLEFAEVEAATRALQFKNMVFNSRLLKLSGALNAATPGAAYCVSLPLDVDAHAFNEVGGAVGDASRPRAVMKQCIAMPKHAVKKVNVPGWVKNKSSATSATAAAPPVAAAATAAAVVATPLTALSAAPFVKPLVPWMPLASSSLVSPLTQLLVPQAPRAQVTPHALPQVASSAATVAAVKAPKRRWDQES